MGTRGDTVPTAAPRADSFRWVVLAVTLTALTTGSVVYQGVSVLIPFWKTEYGLSTASAALGASAIQAGPIVSMLFLGWAIDRYGERLIVSLSMIAMGLASFVLAALAPNYVVLLVLVTVMGAFYGAILPGGQRAIVRWFPPALRGMATGLRGSGLPLGATIAALVLPALALASGWPMAVYVQGGVAIVGGAIFGLCYWEGGGEVAKRADQPKVRIGTLTVGLVRDPAVRSVLVAGLALAALQYTFSAQILLYLRDHLRIDIVTAGFVLAVGQGAGIVGRITLAWISDHLWPGRRMRSLQWMLLVSAVPVVGLALIGDGTPLWLVLTICGMLGMLGIGWYPLYLVQVVELSPQHAVASTISFAITLNQIVAAAMPPLFGLIVGWFNYPIGWLLLVGVMVVAAFQLRRSAAAPDVERSQE
jgi:sugar phosphate permease